MSKSDLEVKKQQFETLKTQFKRVLSEHIEDEKKLELAVKDLADVVLTSWNLEEDLSFTWSQTWFGKED